VSSGAVVADVSAGEAAEIVCRMADNLALDDFQAHP